MSVALDDLDPAENDRFTITAHIHPPFDYRGAEVEFVLLNEDGSSRGSDGASRGSTRFLCRWLDGPCAETFLFEVRLVADPIRVPPPPMQTVPLVGHARVTQRLRSGCAAEDADFPGTSLVMHEVGDE